MRRQHSLIITTCPANGGGQLIIAKFTKHVSKPAS